jgi:hypothetical protein
MAWTEKNVGDKEDGRVRCPEHHNKKTFRGQARKFRILKKSKLSKTLNFQKLVKTGFQKVNATFLKNPARLG